MWNEMGRPKYIEEWKEEKRNEKNIKER